MLKKKGKEVEITPKLIQTLIDQINNLQEEVKDLRNEIAISQEQIENTIKTQEEIIMDMIKKFNDEFFEHKSTVLREIKEIKGEQDILKISYTINEKKLFEQIQLVIDEKVKNQIDGKECEILMKIWIEEFKDIVDNFEKLKRVNPKEFSIRLNEISETISMFKEKMFSEL